MVKKKKILFLVTEDWYFLSHRIRMAAFLIKNGYEVHVCCKNTGQLSEIARQDIICHEQVIRRKSLSIFYFFIEVYKTHKIIKKIQPDIVHLISLRPIVIGLFTSIFSLKTNFCWTFTGLGSIFISKGFFHILLKKIISIFLSVTYRFNSPKVVVQNNDDLIYISKILMINKKKIFLIKGSGVNIDFYHFTKEPEIKNKITLAYTGRILKDKGVHWLIAAFLQAKKEIKNLSLILAGPWDRNNPSAFTEEEFEKLTKINGIHYVGNVKDVRKVWEKANIAILLSKREGLPLGLIEAASMGRSIIATDVPGCREIVKNSINGYIVPPGDINKTKMAILKLSRDNKLRKKFALKGRSLVKKEMDQNIIFSKYLGIYQQLL